MAKQAHGQVTLKRMDTNPPRLRTIPAKFWSDPAPTNPFRKTIPGTNDPLFILVPAEGPAPEPVEAKAKGRKAKIVEQTEDQDNELDS